MQKSTKCQQWLIPQNRVSKQEKNWGKKGRGRMGEREGQREREAEREREILFLWMEASFVLVLG